MLRRIALVIALAGVLYTTSGCDGSSPTEPQTLLRGTVVHHLTGAPVRATVTVITGNFRKVASTDSNGFFSMLVPQGNDLVEVSASGFKPFSATIKIGVGGLDSFQIRLEPV